MDARPWPLIAVLGLAIVSPASAQQEAGADDSLRPRFVAPSDAQDSPFTASNPGPHNPGLLLALSNFEEGPAPAELEIFQPSLGEKLRLIAADERVALLTRIRAISALGSIGDDASFELVAGMALDGEVSGRLRIQALWTIGHRFEGRPGREAVLAGVLGESDHGLRLHAILSLARLGTEEAMEIIDSHRITERHVSVRSVLRDLRVAEEPGRIRLPDEGLAPSSRDRAALPVGEDMRSTGRVEEGVR